MKCLSCECDTSNPKFCSRSCAVKHNNVYTKSKSKPQCACCGTTLKRGRKYCSNICQGQHRKSTTMQKVENGEYVHQQNVRRYLIDTYGAKCILCEWSEINVVTKRVPIEIDHIDGNSQNNSLRNIRLLCPNCHSIQSTYKALNRGNGRHKRLERYRKGMSF